MSIDQAREATQRLSRYHRRVRSWFRRTGALEAHLPKTTALIAGEVTEFTQLALSAAEAGGADGCADDLRGLLADLSAASEDPTTYAAAQPISFAHEGAAEAVCHHSALIERCWLHARRAEIALRRLRKESTPGVNIPAGTASEGT